MSEERWMMFNWAYSREPGTYLYNGSVTQTEVIKGEEGMEEKIIETRSFQKVALEWMLEALSLMLQGSEWPCKVTVFLTGRDEGKRERVWELDSGTVDMIRHNLPGAIRVWSPQHVTVHVKPFVPSLYQEKVNAES